ncbi:PREDICTED: ubiquitin-like protein FUBI [Rhagoletis zephyria]|uniref:ubiquitin-like protein FUBI n=1 Tax=Rhagoletis zephyria TaxID=28612 RepID=UPI0008113581|nr:PREDICTED: ubiquitin-like protein FUBI [Rhagoletis zephyria]
MQIFLRLDGTHAVECESTDVVFALKQHLEETQAIAAAEEAILYHNGRPLDDEEELGQCLSSGAHVDVALRLLGGKVHGSLARAGKVKGQTPKVDKQEKKKKATGRAKRRLQYNRRFVNAVRAPGRRRGPNANVA